MRHSHKKPSHHRKSTNPLAPILLVLGGALLLGLTAFLFWRGSTASAVPIEVSGAPRVKADKEKVDLGDVPLGQTVQVSFEIANVGDQPLRFTGEPYVEVAEGC
jgi:hypothetical protein